MDVPQLVALGRPMVQVCCSASSEVLAHRIKTRDRHPVHRDRSVAAVRDTEGPVDVEALAAQVVAKMGSGRPS